jgi:putative hemolysin
LEVYIIIIGSLIFSAFFSGMEIAFITANKLKVEVDKKSGGFAARLLSRFVRSESSFISTMLVGNNISLVVFGLAFAALMQPTLHSMLPHVVGSEFSVFLLQTLISSVIILTIAEFLPKTLFRINPNRYLTIFALPVTALYYILYPVITITIGLSNVIMRHLLKMDVGKNRKPFDIVDMDNFLKEFGQQPEHEHDQSREIQIFRNAIDFPDVKIRECMIPRTEIIAVPLDEDVSTIRSLFSQTGLSKILIYKDSIDNITGYVHAFDFFRKPSDIHPIIRPIMLVPETMHANKLLKNFIQQRKSIAAVVDEFGGTSGVITIEDIMEEIFGEIDDEYDRDDLMEKKIRDNEYIFSARLEIDYLNEKYGLGLPEDEEYETLGGLLLNHFESIPEKGEEMQIDNWTFKVVQVSEKRIGMVLVRKS